MGHFLWLSDLHVDPFYGTEFAVTHHNSNMSDDDIGNCTQNETLLNSPFGRTGCDSPIPLLDSSLQSAAGKKNANSNTTTTTTTAPKIDFILITGDIVRHGTAELFSSSSSSKLSLTQQNTSGDDIIIDDGPISFTKTVLLMSIRSIRKVFPNVPILPVLGNNDVTPDYYIDVNSSSSSNSNGTSTSTNNTVLTMARDGLDDCFLSEEESQTFANGGYYSRIIQTTSSSSILILSLNTVIYSVNHQPTYVVVGDEENDDDDPLGQFSWIESQLQKAIVGGDDHNNNSTTSSSDNGDDDDDNDSTKIKINAIWMVGHIPPSIGSFRHSQQWSDRYVDRYLTILKNHAQQRPSSSTTTTNNFPTIQGHLFGHIHTEEFRLLTYNYSDDDNDNNNNNDGNSNSNSNSNSNNKKNSSLTIPLLMSSSLSPVYGSNPSYRIVDYDNESGTLLDYTTHYLNLSSSSSSSSSINNDVDNDDNDTDNGGGDDDQNWGWNQLPRFTDVYNVSDLSSNSLDSLITRFENEINDDNSNINNTSEGDDSSSLFETFIKRQHVYSSYEDNDDDGGMVGSNTSIEVKWVCTLRAISKDAYMQCIEERRSSQSEPKTNHGGIILYLTASTVVIAIGVLVVFSFLMGKTKKKKKKKRRIIQRRQYRRPTSSSSLDGVEIRITNNPDTDNGDDNDSNLSFNSNSINGSGIAMTTIKTTTTIGATSREFI
jgi:sphingomyelin phosphodiesterase acid-like 3